MNVFFSVSMSTYQDGFLSPTGHTSFSGPLGGWCQPADKPGIVPLLLRVLRGIAQSAESAFTAQAGHGASEPTLHKGRSRGSGRAAESRVGERLLAGPS